MWVSLCVSISVCLPACVCVYVCMHWCVCVRYTKLFISALRAITACYNATADEFTAEVGRRVYLGQPGVKFTKVFRQIFIKIFICLFDCFNVRPSYFFAVSLRSNGLSLGGCFIRLNKSTKKYAFSARYYYLNEPYIQKYYFRH